MNTSINNRETATKKMSLLVRIANLLVFSKSISLTKMVSLPDETVKYIEFNSATMNKAKIMISVVIYTMLHGFSIYGNWVIYWKGGGFWNRVTYSQNDAQVGVLKI